MSESLASTRDSLKAQWLAANKKALSFREKADEASRQAATIQRAMDALQVVMDGLPETPAPKARQTSAKTQERITQLLKDKGPQSAKQIAEQLQISFSTVFYALKRGPYRSQRGREDGRMRTWSLDESSQTSPALTTAEH